MSIEQAVKDAIDEFGKFAHERFEDNLGFDYYNNTTLLEMILDIQFKPLPELFAHDVKFYGDDAYLMWRYLNKRGLMIFNSNIEVERAIKYSLTIERKNSAALPFDIERAKAGDVVEFMTIFPIELVAVDSIKVSLRTDCAHIVTVNEVTISCFDDSHLRMKYPRRLK